MWFRPALAPRYAVACHVALFSPISSSPSHFRRRAYMLPPWRGAKAMAILRRQFSSSDLGMGIENWYYLARDTETGRIFVYHEWSRRRGDTYEGGSEDIELDSFLHLAGTAQDHLRELIGGWISPIPGEDPTRVQHA
jgi:hypothetical protein